jgi:mxaJ protein
MLYGDYSHPNPTEAIVDAVGRHDVDVAIVWGPIAGYFAGRSSVPLRLDPVTPSVAPWPMTFAIAMGMKKGNVQLRDRINDILRRKHAAIEAILHSYRVPLVSDPGLQAHQENSVPPLMASVWPVT